MKARILATAGLMALLAVGSVYAGQATATVLKANIDFPFVVEGKTLPAGMYEFTMHDVEGVCRVQGAGSTGAIGQIITRTAASIHTSSEGHIVFDEIGGKDILAEVWIPGEDGYILHIQKGPHAHKVVSVAK